ncbi:MAG TPA: helicase-associated domain-containing protein [Ktedonobacteraceae bacterium]|nr:helicase-associated domain-containing protein [Ktedonobacteraceae bacterium]
MKTLRQVFGRYSEEELRQLADWWGVWNRPKEGWQSNMGALANAMQQPIAARFAWEQLSLVERKVLHHALSISASDGMLRDVLLKVTRLVEDVFDEAIATLQLHLLLLEERVSIKSNRVATPAMERKNPADIVIRLGVPKDMVGVLQLVEHEIYSVKQDRSSWKLEQLLASFDANRIYVIGQRYGFVLQDFFMRTDPRVKLASQLTQPDVPYYAWEQFDASTRKLCKWLVEANGAVSMTTARENTGFDNPTLARCISTLEDYAIAFDTFVEHERRLFIPRELLKNLKNMIETADMGDEQEAAGLRVIDAPPTYIYQSGPLALYDLTTIIGNAYQQNIEPTQAGYIPKRIVNKLLPQLKILQRMQSDYREEDMTVDMLFNLAAQLKLLKLSKASSYNGTKPRYEEGSDLRRWVKKSERQMVKALLDHWQDSRYWIDIAGANYDVRSSYEHYYYLDYQAGRKGILSYLTTCEPGRWYSLSSLLRTIKQEKPYILRNKSYQTGVTGYRNAKSTLAKWNVVDGEILTGFLTSSLYEMGIVALGYDRHFDPRDEHQASVNPTSFMLTDFGVSVLGTHEGDEDISIREQKRALIVQPNFELMLLSPDMPTLCRLLPFAQINQVGMVSRLTLTKNSILRYMETGKHVEGILTTLEECSQKELPQNVVYTINDWARSYKEVNISQVFLVEVPNEAMGNDLANSEKLRNFGLRRLGTYSFVASSDTSIQELKRALEKENIVARISGDLAAHDTRAATVYGRYR